MPGSDIRFSPQLAQEALSRAQFQARLAQQAWPSGDVQVDLGEDLLVRTYFSGRSSGVSMYVQLKSTTNLAEHTLRSGDVSYPFEVKDLRHWDQQALPVFLVVWDVQRQAGVWVAVWDALRDLAARTPDWTARAGDQEVMVHLPGGNGTDDDGLLRMHEAATVALAPVIARGREVEITHRFAFDETPAGREMLEKVRRAIEDGEPIVVPPEYTTHVDLPDWVRRLHPGLDAPKPIVMLASHAGATVVPVRLVAVTAAGCATIATCNLRVARGGTERTLWTNDAQCTTLRLELGVSTTEGPFRLGLGLRPGARFASDILEAMRFLRVCQSPGTIRFVPHESPSAIPEFVVDASPQVIETIADETIARLERLVEVEARLGCVFDVRGGWDFAPAVCDAIDAVASAILTGRHVQHAPRAGVTLGDAEGAAGGPLAPVGEVVEVVVRESGRACSFLGCTIELAPSVVTTRGRVVSATSRASGAVVLELADVVATREYERPTG